VIAPFSYKDVIDHVVEASGNQGAFDTSKDSDGDGISDFQEQYFYHTSPYLSDTDGDGIPDKKEIDEHKDPNCPEGKVCHNDVFGTEDKSGVATPSNAPTTENNFFVAQPELGTIDIPGLRQQLIQQGVDPATVNSVDDATLRQVYADTVAQNPGSAPSSLSPSTPTELNSAENQFSNNDLTKLNPREIRQFLKKGGADDSLLNSVDDETLRGIFIDALSKSASQ